MTGFIWNIIVEGSPRGRGYGQSAMIAAEPLLAAHGNVRMGLHVATGNDAARHKYE